MLVLWTINPLARLRKLSPQWRGPLRPGKARRNVATFDNGCHLSTACHRLGVLKSTIMEKEVSPRGRHIVANKIFIVPSFAIIVRSLPFTTLSSAHWTTILRSFSYSFPYLYFRFRKCYEDMQSRGLCRGIYNPYSIIPTTLLFSIDIYIFTY